MTKKRIFLVKKGGGIPGAPQSAQTLVEEEFMSSFRSGRVSSGTASFELLSLLPPKLLCSCEPKSGSAKMFSNLAK